MAPERSNEDEPILVGETRRGGRDSRATSMVPASPGTRAAPELSPRLPWNRNTGGGAVAELRRAVIDCAIGFEWQSPALVHPGRDALDMRRPDQLPGLVYLPPAAIAGTAWPDVTLVRRRDRRLVFAALLPERTTARLSPRKRLVMDLLGSLQWDDALDERRRVDLAVGRPVPSIQAFVWRPTDFVAGTIADVLR